MIVTNTPTKDLAYTNCAYCSPSDVRQFVVPGSNIALALVGDVFVLPARCVLNEINKMEVVHGWSEDGGVAGVRKSPRVAKKRPNLQKKAVRRVQSEVDGSTSEKRRPPVPNRPLGTESGSFCILNFGKTDDVLISLCTSSCVVHSLMFARHVNRGIESFLQGSHRTSRKFKSSRNVIDLIDIRHNAYDFKIGNAYLHQIISPSSPTPGLHNEKGRKSTSVEQVCQGNAYLHRIIHPSSSSPVCIFFLMKKATMLNKPG
ncbi:hypothetical protein L6452_42076 [Arctium lappa]|uniref:Uncharacterized protein n=1 Tax=Arctium lappa TaxID=4217 RepID=A0ACB8XHZ2_ARCLA|nr:hypothetical protein L6452_42076 [Arctium lappa]